MREYVLYRFGFRDSFDSYRTVEDTVERVEQYTEQRDIQPHELTDAQLTGLFAIKAKREEMKQEKMEEQQSKSQMRSQMGGGMAGGF